MPDALTHSLLTRAALALQPAPLPASERLIRDYCLYPDEYFSARWQEIAPYCPFLDGIQFHYLPDICWNPLYRYWKMEDGHPVRPVPFDNANFRHAHAGFRHCIGHAVREFRAGREDAGSRHLGVLLHVLEDSTFGMHALEGPGGADLAFLDRLFEGRPIPTELLAGLRWRDPEPRLDYMPCSLGDSVDELVMRLYAAYCQTAVAARRLCVNYIMDSRAGRCGKTGSCVRPMGEATIRLCADVICTVRQLARGEAMAQPDPLRLETLEAFEFPFGGFGPYRFRSLTHDYVPGEAGESPLALQLGSTRYEHGLAFGSHNEGRLLYWIAPGSFRLLTAKCGLHPAFPVAGAVSVTLMNDGKSIGGFQLDSSSPEVLVSISEPRNAVGLSFCSTPACGVIVLASPELHRSTPRIQ
ncbi:MAG: hypothetical protein IJJ33_02500 [Victivallales bacterium]|nr:hypothetical protein [Victivallales bacterium]